MKKTKDIKRCNVIPVSVRMAPDVLDDIAIRAKKADRDRSKQINHMVKWYIGKNPIVKSKRRVVVPPEKIDKEAR